MSALVKRVEDVAVDRGSCGMRRRLVTAEDCPCLGLSQLRIAGAVRHYHEHSHEIYYVLAGSGTLEVGEERVNLSRGSVVLIPPGTPHHATSAGDLEVLVIMSPATAEGGDMVLVDPA